MNILVTNDDGIRAAGIRALVQALSGAADVFVCAPDSQRSGKSHSLSITESVSVMPARMPGAASAFETTGSPADCVKLGLQLAEEAGMPIDMVYAGINLGGNIGCDTHYSGTVGAAMEGAFFGLPSVAVSVESMNGSHDIRHFDMACELALRALEEAPKLPPGTILNINTPDIPREELQGVRLTRLGHRYYNDTFRRRPDGSYRLGGSPHRVKEDDPEGLDVTAVRSGWASVTPIHYDYTDYSSFDIVRDWVSGDRDPE